MKNYTILWSGHHSDKTNEKTGNLEELKEYFKNKLSWSNKTIKSIRGILSQLNYCESVSYNGYDPYYYYLKTN